MKTKLFSFVALMIVVISCGKKPAEITDQEILENLNGYWKIDQVERPEFNDIREYTFSNYAEYIEVYPDLEGFRIKLQPQLDSTFKRTSNAETFVIKRENDSLRMYYKTQMDEWKETLIDLEKDQFTVVNERGFKYKYKRFESLLKELNQHEQK